MMNSRGLFVALIHHHRKLSTSNFFAARKHHYHFLQHRLLHSSPSPNLLVKAFAIKEDYDLEVKRVQDQSLPAIFCVTTYSEPLCFDVARHLRKMNHRFPNVAISEFVLDAKADNYKSTLKSLGISYTPSFHFFKNGKKVNKVGLKRLRTDAEAYVECLKRIVEQLYNFQPTKSSSSRKNKRTTEGSDVERPKKVSGFASCELILSKEEYNLAVNRIQDESVPAVLYFATYSEFTSTIVYEFLHEDLSERFPHVAIYEFLLDPKEDDYETTLKSLNISSIVNAPIFHFFKNGQKVDELACERFEFYQYGRDLEKILEKLYNTQPAISSSGTGRKTTQELQPVKDKDSKGVRGQRGRKVRDAAMISKQTQSGGNHQFVN
ncbi:putative thioredoxin [Rosa chinensis]|uniref:Putative thioredoxin n=1 Tax=Rosa chinensis TaxID=74649 RepID=A0A2P6RGM1_ROSCH|nr:uncharacterized protein LOC112193140 isoform X2 [Rosa chinensis]PRQ45569.1 putative thioredoxin [Rosa chinensis]